VNAIWPIPSDVSMVFFGMDPLPLMSQDASQASCWGCLLASPENILSVSSVKHLGALVGFQCHSLHYSNLKMHCLLHLHPKQHPSPHISK